MIDHIWATAFAVSALPFCVRGLILVVLMRWLLAWKRPSTSVSIPFLSLLITIAVVAAFPPLRLSGNWINLETGNPPSSAMAYYLDKRWFGLIDFYRFPGQGAVDESVNVSYRPSNSPMFRRTKTFAAIDFPIQIAEVLLLTVYTITTRGPRHKTQYSSV